MHKESEYNPDEAVDRVLELLQEINKKMNEIKGESNGIEAAGFSKN